MGVTLMRRSQHKPEAVARKSIDQISDQLERARQMLNDRVIPGFAAMARNARAAAEPVGREAARRGRLVAAALRGVDGAVSANHTVVKRRRWPVALVFLGVGSAIGAAVAWVLQAGKPVQLAPYPAPPKADQESQEDQEAAAHPDRADS
ncbi:MAG: hypothetical protein IRZ02_09740 [Acidothermus sp.]|nr:hypothetical protein [Acidothermus sp.]